MIEYLPIMAKTLGSILNTTKNIGGYLSLFWFFKKNIEHSCMYLLDTVRASVFFLTWYKLESSRKKKA